MFSIAALSAAHVLEPALLLVICGVASLTGPLSWAGLRSMFPSIVPGHLWERANAIDSSSDVLATVIGAPIGGLIVALAGPEWALATSAALFVCAGAAMLRVRDPAIKDRSASIFAEARAGLSYVVRDRSLVGLAATFITFGAGWGCIVIAVPVLVLGRLHGGPAAVGYIWGAVGVAGFFSTFVAGRIDTRGRERQLMAGSILAMAAALAFLPRAASVVVVAAALIAVALVETPFDIAFLTLRQRRTDPNKFGRMFAVSMALNQLGGPIGSAMAGALIAWSLTGALWVAVVLVAVAAAIPLVAIPAGEAAGVSRTVRTGSEFRQSR
jgi:predicted MFS family arabinose efflux permease